MTTEDSVPNNELIAIAINFYDLKRSSQFQSSIISFLVGF